MDNDDDGDDGDGRGDNEDEEDGDDSDDDDDKGERPGQHRKTVSPGRLMMTRVTTQQFVLRIEEGG